MEMRACQRKICRRKRGLEERLQCHVEEEQGSPYHWASFVLWGSWVMRGVGDEGGLSDEVREEVLSGKVGDIGDLEKESGSDQNVKEKDIEGDVRTKDDDWLGDGCKQQ